MSAVDVQPTAEPARIDPRTVSGTLITNGRHMWEIQDHDGHPGHPAVNQLTGYTIVLNDDTIQSCWIVPSTAEYAALLQFP